MRLLKAIGKNHMGLLSGNDLCAGHSWILSPTHLSPASISVYPTVYPSLKSRRYFRINTRYVLGLDSAVTNRKSQNNSGLNKQKFIFHVYEVKAQAPSVFLLCFSVASVAKLHF